VPISFYNNQAPNTSAKVSDASWHSIHPKRWGGHQTDIQRQPSANSFQKRATPAWVADGCSECGFAALFQRSFTTFSPNREIARFFVHLPYHHTIMSCCELDNQPRPNDAMSSIDKSACMSFVSLTVKLTVYTQIYPSQTKILEGRTKDEIMIFEALFKGVSTRFGLRIVEKSVDVPDFIFCSSFQNIRLVSIKFIPPKRRFWKEEQKMKCGFRRKHFSRAWVLNLGHEPWKSSKIRISSFVPPSKIFVWGA
jgi:hypothetical protein